MSIPGQTFTERTDGLATSGVTVGDTTFLFVGASSSGAPNTIANVSRPSTVVSTFGQGALPETAAFLLSQAGGQHKAMRANTSTPGVAGAVTASRVGSSTGTITVAATQLDATKVFQIDDPTGTPSYVDDTTDFNDAGTADVDPWPSSEAVGDQLAIGHTSTFQKVNVTLSTAGSGGTMAVKYWNGTAWTAVSGLTDASTGLTAGTSTYGITFTVPSDWAKKSINGSAELYFLVFEVATIYSTNPVISQGKIELPGPYDAYDVTVEVTADGTLGAGEFRYTLDGGRNYSPSIVIPSGGEYDVADTGITLTFTAGAGPDYFDDGDLHRFACDPPYMSSADLTAAISAIVAERPAFDVLVLCGWVDTASTAATFFSALATQMGTLENAFVFAGALVEASYDTAANVKSSFAGVTSNRIGACYGRGRFSTAKPFTGWGEPLYSIVPGVAVQAARVTLSGDLKRVATGAIPGYRELEHDEAQATVGLNDSRIITLRTWEGRQGVYVTQAWTKSEVGDDFLYWHRRRVMDRGATVLHVRQQALIGRTPRANADASIPDGTAGAPGTLYEADARAYEKEVLRSIDVALKEPRNAEGEKGHVSARAYTIDRTNNILTSGALLTELAIVPLVTINEVQTTLRYALAVAPAA